MKVRRRHRPVHPGKILSEEFMKPLGLTSYRVAVDCGLRPPRIHQIVHGQRGITADTALRLGRYFGTSAQFWMNLQAAYDLAVAEDKLGGTLMRQVKVLPRSA
jgi:addiction module HigA family antidote